jgi:hypothetical protein
MSEFSGPLRALFEKIATPVDIDRVMSTDRTAERRRPGWLVPVVAAAVVLIAGGGWLLLGRTERRPAVTSTLAAGGWAVVPADPASLGGPGEQRMSAVTPGGPGLVAVGTDCFENDCDGAVWTSADGLHWTRVDAPAGVFDGPGSRGIEAVTLGGPGLVAVGSEFELGVTGSSAVVWTSPDGLNWSRASGANPDLGGPGDRWMFGVVAGGPGFVAVGMEHVDEPDEGDAAVWTSPDGQNWTRVPDPSFVFGGSPLLQMRSVTTGGPGLVAVGIEYTDRGHRPAVWTSADGLVWQRAPADQEALRAIDNSVMSSVTAWGSGLVAVGSTSGSGMEDQRAAAWTSSDGVTWTKAPDQPAFDAPSFLLMSRVVAGDEGLAAIGTDYTVGVPNDAAVWTSPDGVWWTRVTDTFGDLGGPGDQWMQAVAIGGPGLVAVGADEYNGETDAAVWYWPAERSGRTDTRPPDPSTSTTPVVTTFGCPFRQSALPEQELPAVVAETRERIYQAAINCDFQALSQLATEAGGIYYPNGTSRARGELPSNLEDMAWFVQIADALERPYCTVADPEQTNPDDDKAATIYQWPAVAQGEACQPGFAIGVRNDGRWYAATDSSPTGNQVSP